MTQAKLNNELIATVAGDITVFSYDGETREYLSSSVEYLALGVGIPANSCIDAPGESKAGFAICRTADFIDWEYVADHRGETVYSTETGTAVVISSLGNYPKNTVTLAPTTPYDKWNGSAWVTDTDAKTAAAIAVAENERQRLLAHADAILLDWRAELMLGEISEANRAKLSAWLAYKNEVKTWDIKTDPENVNWPVPPEA